LLILGAGKFATEVAELAEDAPDWFTAGFVQNESPNYPVSDLLGLPVYWIDEVVGLLPGHHAISGIGTTIRQNLIDPIERLGFEFASISHPTAHVSKSCELAPGSLVSPGCVIASNSVIGRHTLVNRGSTVGHHSRIGANCIIGPGVDVAGACIIGDNVVIGMGSTILNDITIGEGSSIAAGSIVVKTVPPFSKVMLDWSRIGRSTV
jgi:sugar O-acyltransferase (sialic acid O-acetyltransferase NeuD family)